jgi:hypothetical protein
LIAITPRAESVYLSPLNNNLINRSTSALSSGQSLSSLQKNRVASQSFIGDDVIASSQSMIQSMRSSVESESYTIVGPDSLQQHHDATIGLQKVYEKELKDCKATELKVSSMPSSLRYELNEVLSYSFTQRPFRMRDSIKSFLKHIERSSDVEMKSL